MSPVTAHTMNAAAAASQQLHHPHGQQQEVATPADEIGWEFLQKYYHTLHQDPLRLIHFYTKTSVFVHGYEKENTPKARGLSEISERIKEIGFNDFKVRVTQVDSQAAPNNSVLISVLGRMSISGRPFQRFSQSFYLYESNGRWYLNNDNLRFLLDDEELEGGESQDVDASAANGLHEEAEAQAEVAPASVETIAEPVAVAPAPVAAVEAPAPATAAVEESAPAVVAEPVQAAEPVPVAPEVPIAAPEVKSAPVVAAAPAPAPAAAAPEKVAEPPKKPSTWAAMAAANAAKQNNKPAVNAAKSAGAAAPPASAPAAANAAASAPRSASPSAAAVPAAAAAASGPAPAATAAGQVASPANKEQPKGPKPTGPRREDSFEKAARDNKPGVFVRGIRENVAEDLIKTSFTKFGEVANVRIHTSKRSVIVEFVKAESAEAALKEGALQVEDMNLQVTPLRPAIPHQGPPRGGSNNHMRGSGRGAGANNGSNRHHAEGHNGEEAARPPRREGDDAQRGGRGGRGGPRGGRRPSVGGRPEAPVAAQ